MTISNINYIPGDYPASFVFGIQGSPWDEIMLPGFAPGHPSVPPVTENIVFEEKTARDFIEWLHNGESLLIVGPTGCGKTASVLSVLGRLSVPTAVISCGPTLEPGDIFGETQLVDGSTRFVPGPAVEIIQEGGALVFDEIDNATPQFVTSLNRLMEGCAVMLPNGSMVQPHPDLLIVATANTRGDGDGSSSYVGTNVLNIASLNRFEKWEMDYPSQDIERQILEANYGEKSPLGADGLDSCVLDIFIKTAADIRTAFKQGNCPIPMSIRDLLRWCKLTVSSQKRQDVSPIHHAFDRAFANGVDSDTRNMLHQLLVSHLGLTAEHALSEMKNLRAA